MPTAYEYHGPRESVSLSQEFPVSAARLFAAWVTPAQARRWLFTTQTSTSTVQMDPRIGGRYTVTRHSQDRPYTAVGQYLEVQPPIRLVFTFAIPQFAADADTIIVQITPTGDDRCRLDLTHQGLRPGYDKATRNGWLKMFRMLEKILTPESHIQQPVSC